MTEAAANAIPSPPDNLIKPQDIINRYSVEELCQSADDYFSSITDPTEQMAKPFGNMLDGPAILQNMGLLLSEMRLGPTTRVLEFGAGTCWLSRFLLQARCQVIACDASRAALEIGKRLFREQPVIGPQIAEPQFLWFDGHKIDLPDESVDRIICFDSFHHVPNQEEVIAELARVLKKGGIAGFSEPGRIHSTTRASQHEMKNYAVLENDIVVEDLFAIAGRYGFTDIRIKLIADLLIPLEQHQAILHSSTNALQATQLAITVAKNVRAETVNRNIFYLYKGPFLSDSRSMDGLSHRLEPAHTRLAASAGQPVRLNLRITNTGSALWLHENIDYIGVVRVGTHLYGEDGTLIDFDFSRHDLPKAVRPGEHIDLALDVTLPSAGSYRLAVDLVSEHVCWFERLTSHPVSIQVDVAEPGTAA